MNEAMGQSADVGDAARTPHQIAEELARERARLIEAQAVANVGSWETDLSTLAVTWSAQTHRIFETDPDRFQPTHQAFLAIVHPDDREAVDAAFAGSVDRVDPCAIEHRLVMADGRVKTVEERWQMFRDAEGRPVRAVGTCRDITAQKALEIQLRQAQKLEAIGLLAGGIAHDFNNLLTIINGASNLALDGLEPGSPIRGLIAEIQRAGERAAALTRQLLVFSRKQVVDPHVLDLNAVVGDAERLMRRVIGEDILLTFALSPAPVHVKADASQLEQVLMNLAINSRDAMPQGGTLAIATSAVTLDAAWCEGHPEVAPGEYIRLVVRDSGHGMDERTLAHAFEPFFTTKAAGKGTGLGLATVHGIVRQAGGTVTVESEVGRGTMFEVFLPRAEAPHREAPAGATTRRMPRGTETLLLAEDEDVLRGLARHVLQSCGYTVLDAPHGAAALAVAAAHDGPIHALVTDVVMPHLGGRELAERLSAQRPDCRVLFLSGYTDDAVLRHGVEESAVAFLQKPFTPLTLAEKVRAVLDGPPPGRPPG